MAEESQPTSVEEVPIPDAAELEDTEAQDDQEQSSDQGDETTGEDATEAESEAEANSDDEGDAESSDTQDPKEQARRGYANRQRIKSDVTQALDQLARPQTAADLVEQGIDPALAEVEALRQEIQRKDVINQVTELNAGLNVDANNVMRDFPVFNESSSDYDPQFAQEVEELYKQASQFQVDPSGRFVVSASLPLYDFYAKMAQFRGSGVRQGAVKGQKAAEKMLSAAETPSSAPAKDAGGEDDAFLKGLTGD